MSVHAIDYYRCVRFGDRYPSRKLLMILLADRADEEFACFPSVGLLADEMETDRRAIQRHLKKLMEDGYLSIEDRFRENKSSTSNRYHLHGPWDNWGGTGKPFPLIESRKDGFTLKKEGEFRQGSSLYGEGGLVTAPTTWGMVTEPGGGRSRNRPRNPQSNPQGDRQKNPHLSPRAHEGSAGESTIGKSSPEVAAGGRGERDSATPHNPVVGGAGGTARAGRQGKAVPDERVPGGAEAPASSLDGSPVLSPEPVVEAYVQAAREASRRPSRAAVEKVRRQVAARLSKAPWEPFRNFLAEVVVEMGENGWTDLEKHLGKNPPPPGLEMRPWCGNCGDPTQFAGNDHPRTNKVLRVVFPEGREKPCPDCYPRRHRAA